MSEAAPLLILADLPPDFRLTSLMLSDADRAVVQLDRKKYLPLQQIEATVDGLSFTIQYRPNATTGLQSQLAGLDRVFCSHRLSTSTAGLAIMPSANLAGGRRIMVINRALLDVARIVGRTVAATAVIWTPANLLIGFDYFSEATADYRTTGSFPLSAQIAIRETETNALATRGLRYFIGQEIELIGPPNHRICDILRISVRIINRLIANGHCDDPIQIIGLESDQLWTLTPSEDRTKITVRCQTSNSSIEKGDTPRDVAFSKLLK